MKFTSIIVMSLLPFSMATYNPLFLYECVAGVVSNLLTATGLSYTEVFCKVILVPVGQIICTESYANRCGKNSGIDTWTDSCPGDMYNLQNGCGDYFLDGCSIFP